jgi:hypothetical protein
MDWQSNPNPITIQLQSNLCTTTTFGTPNLWPLSTGGRCSEVGFMLWGLRLGLQNGGRCRQVVAIRRWSLTQVWLYLRKNERQQTLKVFCINVLDMQFPRDIFLSTNSLNAKQMLIRNSLALLLEQDWLWVFSFLIRNMATYKTIPGSRSS